MDAAAHIIEKAADDDADRMPAPLCLAAWLAASGGLWAIIIGFLTSRLF